MDDVEQPRHYPTWLIVTIMSLVIGCLVVTSIAFAINETSTQRNAERESRDNEELRVELRCRAVPQLAYDVADANLNILIASSLANLSTFTDEERTRRIEEVNEAIADVEAALDARTLALEECQQD